MATFKWHMLIQEAFWDSVLKKQRRRWRHEIGKKKQKIMRTLILTYLCLILSSFFLSFNLEPFFLFLSLIFNFSRFRDFWMVWECESNKCIGNLIITRVRFYGSFFFLQDERSIWGMEKCFLWFLELQHLYLNLKHTKVMFVYILLGIVE